MEHRVQDNKTKSETEMIIWILPHPSPKNKYLHTKVFFRNIFSLVGDHNMSIQGQRDFKDTPGCDLCVAHKVSGLPGEPSVRAPIITRFPKPGCLAMQKLSDSARGIWWYGSTAFCPKTPLLRIYPKEIFQIQKSVSYTKMCSAPFITVEKL